VERNPGLPLEQANVLAWTEGRRRLEQAISSKRSFALETTLGGRTISRLLHQAAEEGMALKVWYVALDGADRHVARVKARTVRGGHGVPERLIRARYDESRANLTRLIPKLTSLRVYDNTYEARIDEGERVRPRLILEFVAGHIRNRKRLADTPAWAKPIVAAALKAERPSGRQG
jgi:predicted ABC-type ATPase